MKSSLKTVGETSLHLGVNLNIDECEAIIDQYEEVNLDFATSAKLDASFRHFRERSVTEPIYGVNTGLGPMVTSTVPRDQLIEQQYQLVYSHASGLGDPIGKRYSRAAVLSRAQSFSQGYSAVRAALPERLCAFLNNDVVPAIPRHGGVGASGDLVQLAHVALSLIGQGDMVTSSGTVNATDAHEEHLNVRPLRLMFRDGLALCNGTSCMTGIAICNVIDAKRLMDQAIELSACIARVAGTDDQPFDELIQQVKRHRGQREVARRIREQLARLSGATGISESRPLQEHYSIRCTPQILGPLMQTLNQIEDVVMDEFHSVSDNPIFNHETDEIAHGGNFHGEAIAAAMDQLKIVVAKITMLLERQINFLLNNDVNKILPPFLNRATPGIQFGLQGAQFSAVSTTAHTQSLSFPMSLHSIPSNKDNQDIVSMGSDAALMTAEVIDNSFHVLAINTACVAEAMTIAKVEPLNPGALPRGVEHWFDLEVPPVLNAPLSPTFKRLAQQLREA
ncbi:MAG: aromatic amino acid lyase [Parvularculaceae bacterium]|nr:aromatic amino acid lyase [Parvularculaceae bacterium]